MLGNRIVFFYIPGGLDAQYPFHSGSAHGLWSVRVWSLFCNAVLSHVGMVSSPSHTFFLGKLD